MDAPDTRRSFLKGLGSGVPIGIAALTSALLLVGTSEAHAEVNLTCGLRESGCYGHNGGTSIYVGPVGTYKVRGAIRDHWGALGWENSSLGYPYSNEFCGLRSGGCGTRFERGESIMYWSPQTPASFVRGLIGQKFASLGWERSHLGYPTGDEFCGLTRGGCGNHFQGGSIYWSASTGAHISQGLIRDRWGQLGWENGVLGYPRTDEYTKDGTIFQEFEGGWLAWSGGDVYGEPWMDTRISSRLGTASTEQVAKARNAVGG